MRKLFCILLVFICLFSSAVSESPESAMDFVLSQGFSIADVDDYSGVPRCYMMEDSGWQSIAFTTTDKIYGVIALEEFDANFNPEKLRSLFFNLVQKFDFKIMYYWPNYDTADQIAVSYGITQALDKTKLNYSSKSEFVNALSLQLFDVQPVNDRVDTLDSAIETYKNSIYQNFGFERNSVTAFMEDHFGMPLLTSKFATLSTNVCAEYVLGSDFAACRTGIGSENMLIYTYPEKENSNAVSDSEIWAYYSSLKSYIADNKTSIIADGSLAGADTLWVIIDIITNNSYDRAVYDLITDECTIQSMN